MTYTVYKHTSPSGKVYIGITSMKPEYRWRNGMGYSRSPIFYKAIQKYGWDNFKHEILAEGLTKEQAQQMEIDLIAHYKSNDKNHGYNMSTGGESGHAGCSDSEELRRWKSDRFSGENNPHYGKHHTEEARLRISEAHKGKKLSPEVCHAISEGHKGLRCKPICQYTLDDVFIREWKSMSEASEKTGISIGNICSTCKGRFKQTGGYIWRYKDGLQ